MASPIKIPSSLENYAFTLLMDVSLFARCLFDEKIHKRTMDLDRFRLKSKKMRVINNQDASKIQEQN